MKFINTKILNALHDEFQRCRCNNGDFQDFVEQSKDDGKTLCLDPEEIRGFLENLHDEDYGYLLECDDEDLELWGQDYLRRVNFFRRLLGEETELTIDDVTEDRGLLQGEKEK